MSARVRLRRRSTQPVLPRFLLWCAAVFILSLVLLRTAERFSRVPLQQTDGADLVTVTAYCNCGRCCGWRRNFFGFGEPVYTYGRLKGKPKEIGRTACGTKAKHGTIAADPRLFPFGTHLYVPGYGVGTVEDVGGAIKGRHIDVWFPTHAAARRWGVRRLKVEVRGRSVGKQGSEHDISGRREDR
jgi:3D (Asp-Asp-Asp) domain-containing protein